MWSSCYNAARNYLLTSKRPDCTCLSRRAVVSLNDIRKGSCEGPHLMRIRQQTLRGQQPHAKRQPRLLLLRGLIRRHCALAQRHAAVREAPLVQPMLLLLLLQRGGPGEPPGGSAHSSCGEAAIPRGAAVWLKVHRSIVLRLLRQLRVLVGVPWRVLCQGG